ncbi:hypothetical protein HanPSC8_Chr09g0350401 [Helianthus annuus]|nr:hypothetical protein HanPSC8_Chr09g0350401 [Helianthus annuus]
MYFHFLMYVHDHPYCLMTTCVLVTTKEFPKWKIYLPTSCMTDMIFLCNYWTSNL